MNREQTNLHPVELKPGGYYVNGHGDTHGPLQYRAPGVWLDENGILYHPDGRQWSHTGDSAGNLIRVAKRPVKVKEGER